MTLTLYGIPTCDTCRKARKALEGAGHEVAFRDVRAEPLSPAERAEFAAALGPKIVNRASPSFRKLDDTVKESAPEDILAAQPTAMKRPVIRREGELYLGWSKDVQAALL
ncbi:Arsenate reductase, glutaredoxin family [Tranquillimonas rosea]|uniref:Arsenate reductase, glutaredoxin family n=1 Tax=Tranquillimonas rosea TaxID=641238 RepID=A0A1H9WC79_9RHOB|nr:ArsC/Spx/MgsR family protein [Tranquillimonas rosea]SES31556.1 Arsenate reductase, glutaredoxin family [Tranquillimonas rosea]